MRDIPPFNIENLSQVWKEKNQFDSRNLQALAFKQNSMYNSKTSFCAEKLFHAKRKETTPEVDRPDSIVKIPLGKLVSVDKYRMY